MIKVLVSMALVFALPALSFAKTTCQLEVGTDDSVDLSADDVLVMKDSKGKELKNLPLEMLSSSRSDMIVASYSPVSVATQNGTFDGVQLSLGVEIPAVGIVAVTDTKILQKDGASVQLDLTQIPKIRDTLGAKYKGCDDKVCHANFVILSCK